MSSFFIFTPLRMRPVSRGNSRRATWVRPETIKLLEENIGKTLSDIHHSRILYDPPPRILEIKAKINKWDLVNLKSFCTSKETISKVKRQPSVERNFLQKEEKRSEAQERFCTPLLA